MSVDDAFSEIDKAHGRIETDIAAGKNLTTREVGAAGQSFAVLTVAIVSTYGSLPKAPSKIRERYAAIEKYHVAQLRMIAMTHAPVPAFP